MEVSENDDIDRDGNDDDDGGVLPTHPEESVDSPVIWNIRDDRRDQQINMTTNTTCDTVSNSIDRHFVPMHVFRDIAVGDVDDVDIVCDLCGGVVGTDMSATTFLVNFFIWNWKHGHRENDGCEDSVSSSAAPRQKAMPHLWLNHGRVGNRLRLRYNPETRWKGPPGLGWLR